MMPAQEEYDYDSDTSITSSASGASVVSEASVPKRQAKPVAKRPNAPKAGHVRLF
jgi:hypothetical protein